MQDAFSVPDTLELILDDFWRRWVRGVADRRSPFHTPVVASVSGTQVPEQRVMVLRKANREQSSLRFHTDRRSLKAEQIGVNAAVSITGYDYGAKIQLRCGGSAALTHTGRLANEAWAATSVSGRRSYLTTLAPGTASAMPTAGLPVAFENGLPTPCESETGRANFSIVQVTLDRFEWLHLAASGHRRAAFMRNNDDWTGTWLIP